MIPTFKVPYRDGELRIGWASWDKGKFQHRSIKYAYPDSSGKISRGSPELPFDILMDMVFLSYSENELPQATNSSPSPIEDVSVMDYDNLKSEEKNLKASLILLQHMLSLHKWADFNPLYDQIGSRLDKVKAELSRKRSQDSI